MVGMSSKDFQELKSSSETVNERLRVSIILKKYFNPSLIDFIEQVQSYEYIPEITKVAEDMGLHASTVWKFMNVLKSKGLNFTSIIDIEKLGLEEVIIIIDEYIPINNLFKATLRLYAPILPWGTLLKYLVPRNMSEAFINELASIIPKEPREVLILTHVVPTKPSLAKYYDLKSKSIKLDWNDLLNQVINTPRESVPRTLISRDRFDEIDLYILKELELNPFTSLKKVTEKLNKELRPKTQVNYIRILRHYKNHIETRGIIKGVKLRLAPLVSICAVPVIAITKGNPADIYRVCRVLGRHPYLLSASINPEAGLSIMEAYIPMDELFNFSIFLKKLEGEGIIKECHVYILDDSRRKEFTLPYNIFSIPIVDMVKEFKQGRDLTVTEEFSKALAST